MSWRIITDDWRLKLLALGLAVLMLGAVAFSQNPPTVKTLTVGLSYPNTTNNPIVLINPPSSTTVTVRGLSDLIAIVEPANLTATVDVSHARPGSRQKFDVTVIPTIPGTLSVDPPAPVLLNIDALTTKEVPVEVKANPAAGWAITSTVATCPGSTKPNPCSLHFTGPAGWMANLHAYALYPQPVAGSGTSPNQPVQLQNNSGFVDYQTCGKVLFPTCSLDVTLITIQVVAVAGVTSATVALLDLPPTHGPANGYRITGLTITPNTVTVSGDPVQVAKVHNITLPAIDLTGKTSDYSSQVNIPYPDGISGSTATAMIKYSISANPAVSPSASPT